MNRKRTQQFSYIFGITMAVLMALTLVLPAFRNNQNTANTVVDTPAPTTVPIPTFPPPITDFSRITFDEQYLQPSGLYTIGIPTGWTPTTTTGTVNNTQVAMSNPDAVSVIQAYLVTPPTENPTVNDVDALFTEAALASSWREYTNPNLLSRRIVEDRVVIDFSLERSQQQFLAQHVAWTDGDYVYVVRVVVPQNGLQMLNYLLENLPGTFQKNPQFVGTPIEWTGFFDTVDHHIMRFPTNWQVMDGRSGRPVTLTTSNGAAVLIEAVEGTTIADADAATSFIEGLRSGTTVQNVAETTRAGGSGFVVDYVYVNPDGESRNGEAVLLNGEDDQLHVANALLPIGATIEESDVSTALSTFSLLLGLNLPQPEPTATPVPTEVPVEATAEPEMTAEATEEVMEATEEATSDTDMTEEAPMEATAEATAEATEEAS